MDIDYGEMIPTREDDPYIKMRRDRNYIRTMMYYDSMYSTDRPDVDTLWKYRLIDGYTSE